MVRLFQMARWSIVFGLPVVLPGQCASASTYTQQLHHRAPQATTAVVPTTSTLPSPTASATSVTAVSECHLHESSIYCLAGTTEYLVHTTATPTPTTTAVPSVLTKCHEHGSEIFCYGPDGGEVEISLVAAESEHDESGHDDHEHDEETTTSSPASGQTCHFHAGVEHCTTSSGSDAEATVQNCSRVDRDYNIPLRVGLLFVILTTSAIGVFTPILIAKFVPPQNVIFTIIRQFGTGVIVSTAFVHLFTHATLMFDNECLGELAFEATAAAILMGGLFLSFLVEYAGSRLVSWHGAKTASRCLESPGPSGLIFSMAVIGITLVVAGDSFFITLFIVIVFHQMFEGLALGSRIAALGQPLSAGQHGGHGHHGHGRGHFHDKKQSVVTTAFGKQPEDVATPSPQPSDESGSSRSNSDDAVSAAAAAAATSGEAANQIVANVPMRKKMLLALAFALVTPVGMAIGIGALRHFNGNDPSTIIAIGTLDALSAGILVWVGLVEMWAQDWMVEGGEMTTAGPAKTGLGLVAMVAGMVLMSLLGKWA
ncbi:hypothetical protein B0T17DRAFT_531374 [Bombardia bombarda]|uniref:Zinc transporter n=1 Tax=Bombardia bombarda TaxID=252184 RepID=A0AA39X096_9PEZI|nr:hypothetical protein B0T17DRAFT_531374 [Bombardia bombarda]